MAYVIAIIYVVVFIGAYLGISSVNKIPEPFPGCKFMAEVLIAMFWPISLIAKLFAYIFKE